MSQAYRRALRDFMLSIPDGHITAPLIREDFDRDTRGGLGMSIRELDDGRTVVNFLTQDGPAERAGMQLGAEIISIDGQPVADYVSTDRTLFGALWHRALQALAAVALCQRVPLDKEVEVSFQNPGASEPETATLTAEDRRCELPFLVIQPRSDRRRAAGRVQTA